MSNYHGPTTLQERHQKFMRKMGKGYHNVLGLIGPPGSGKSTDGRVLARKMWPEFDPHKHLVFGESNVVPLAKKLGRGAVIVCDEGDESGNKMRSMSKEGVSVGEFLDKARKLGQTYIFIRPFYEDWSKGVKKHLQWVDVCGPVGYAEAHEVISLGKFKHVDWKQPRFPYQFPDDREAFPAMHEAYNEVVKELLASQDAGVYLELRRQRERLLGILQRELGSGRLRL